MTASRVTKVLGIAVIFVATMLGTAGKARAAEWLCDPAYQDCRQPLIDLINKETVGIDVAFWFMQDTRYETAILNRWYAGVPVRVLVDPKANPTYTGNAQVLADLAAAGIPMRQRASNAPGILHWKMMLFVGQNTVEFSGANYSPTAFVYQSPYSDYEDETPYFTDDPSIVNSFKTEYDNFWIDTVYYTNYANITALVRNYPIFTKDPSLNFPQQEDYAKRILKRYAAETQAIDVIMYRITDERHTDAMISALQRGVPVRLISDTFEYRNSSRLWVAYNLDKLWAAGIPLRVRAHAGLNHQKLVIMRSQAMAVFGSSNWTSPSANQQQEHNYFTTKPWMYQWFSDQFDRKWNNLAPNGAIETDWFTPLPPDKPIYSSPATGAIITAGTTVTLKWNGGPWGQVYDVYFGVDPNPPLFAANLKLGPTDPAKPKLIQQYTLPTLEAGTTYYWRIVSKTMAGLTAKGPTYSFTTTGTPPPPPPPPPGASTVVIWAKDVPSSVTWPGWQFVTDPTAAGGTALYNPDKGKSTISPPLASPTNYFEVTFSAVAGVPYHLWTRMRAYNDSLSNDALSVQFSDSQDQFGSPMYQISTTSGAEIVLQDGKSGWISGWGWSDNGYGTFGPDVYFATTGTHTMRVQQRTDGVVVDQFVLSPDTYVRTSPGLLQNDTTVLGSTISGAVPPAIGPLPAGWSDTTVGIVGINGYSSYDGTNVYTVIGGGGDIWGTADGMQFAYQPLSGDGSIVARVTGLTNASTWSRAGVMIRESLAKNSANAYMYLSSGSKTLAFQRRSTTGGATEATAGSTSAVAPRWVRLDRAGNIFTAYSSTDGATWTFVGSDTVGMAASTVYVGLAVTSATLTKTTTATFDNVSMTPGTPVAPVPPPPAPYLPPNWNDSDIGNIGFTGTASFDQTSSIFTVKGAGADIWGTADAFHYLYAPLIGDGTITARVRTLQNTSSSAKAGVMIRQSLDPAAANVLMAVTPGKGTAFQARTSAGATTGSVTGSLVTAPYWVKLERIGDTFNAYQSPDGAAWTLIGSQTIQMGAGVYVGLAVTSHNIMATATATFDNVVTTP